MNRAEAQSMGTSRTFAVTAFAVVVGGAGSGGPLIVEDGACQVVKLCVCLQGGSPTCPVSGVSWVCLQLASSLQGTAVIPGGVEALAMSPAGHNIHGLGADAPAWPRAEALSSLSP